MLGRPAMPSKLPLNEQTIRSTSGSTSYYYGFDVTLTQADVPYVIPAQGRPPSQFDFVVCADTVRIASALVNPGKDIRINARRLIVQRGAMIDTGGADPQTSYSPGVPAQQTVVTPG